VRKIWDTDKRREVGEKMDQLKQERLKEKRAA
jgi:hypothetical protein